MLKILFLSSFAYFHIIYSSSEILPYVEPELMRAYYEHLAKPNQVTYNGLKSRVLKYFEQFPLDCLKLLERHRNDWIFKVIFLRALTKNSWLIDPSLITPNRYSEVLIWLSFRIREIFLYCSSSNEAKFNIEMETIYKLIDLAQRTLFELKSLCIRDVIVNEFDDRIAVWKYSVKNISIDFEHKSINYYSLFRTLNEIIFITKTIPTLNSPSLQLSERYFLLWIYLIHIHYNDCETVFQIHHHHRTLIVYFIMKFWGGFGLLDVEFYPNRLSHLLERLYETGSPQLEPIVELLGENNPHYDCKSWGIQMFSISYLKLSSFLQSHPIEIHCSKMWRINALAELELYLNRKGQSFSYSRDDPEIYI